MNSNGKYEDPISFVMFIYEGPIAQSTGQNQALLKIMGTLLMRKFAFHTIRNPENPKCLKWQKSIVIAITIFESWKLHNN